MAANLVSVTVLKINGQDIDQSATYATQLLNKNRVNSLIQSGTDSLVEYETRSLVKSQVTKYLLDDTYSTMNTALVTNQYTAGQAFDATVVAENGVAVTAYNATLKVDRIIDAVEDPANSAQSIVRYEQPWELGISTLTLNVTLAQLITDTTT